MSPSMQTVRWLVRLEETGGVGMATKMRKDIGNLPLELTSLVDREDQVAETKARLATARLVTLTGMGGVGKTRLALRVAADVRTEFEDGVWFVPLDRLPDPALLTHTVAATLGVREHSAGPPLEVLVGYLTERRLLLLLDNCEHLLDACAALAMRLLQSCPDLRILATSREPLGLRGEATLSVPPLAVPDSGARYSLAEVSGYDAVTLFTERAVAAVPEFSLREDNQAAVAEIVHRLDGLPLAIELAAAQLRALPIDEIAHRLSDRSRPLAPRQREVPARQQTLWASLQWSYDLCSPLERLLWARLSVFTGGFELDAAEAVCAGAPVATDAILDLVAALVDKSIAIRERAGNLARYRLLEPVRNFGWTKLGEMDEAEALRRRHRDWYANFVSESDADWIGPRQADWLNRMDRDMPNLRAALEFSLSEPGETRTALRMTTTLAHSCWWRGWLSEGRHWLDRALAHDAGRNPDRLRALQLNSVIAALQGDFAVASSLVEQGGQLADQLGDESSRAQASLGSGMVALLTGDHRRATEYFQASLDQFRKEGDLRSQIEALGGLGRSVRFVDERRANAYLEEVLAITESRGELFYRSISLMSLGIAAWLERDPHRAASLLTRALGFSNGVNPVSGAWCIEVLAWVAANQHDHRRAAILLGVAHALADAMGTTSAGPPYLTGYHDECERQARIALGEEAFEASFEDGIGMRQDDAVAYALKPSLELVSPGRAAVEPPRAGPAPQADAADAPHENQRPVVRVLIVDRHRVVADGIQLVLEQHADLQVVGIATNAGDAEPLASATRPDVILADYQLADATGAELAARLRKNQPATRVLLLSSVVSNALLQEAVKAGARGFLLKTQPAEELVDAVRRTAAGEMLIPAGRLAALLTGSETGAPLFNPLTGREREVLRLLAAGLDNRHIAARMGIGYVTVRSHLRNLSSKLDAHSRLEILARAAELGLMVR
jgi:predicted ATPase/DNA-binding NarL/FixJ family response regulator